MDRYVLGSAGCKTDVDQRWSVLDIKLWVYMDDHKKPMATSPAVHLLVNTLYMKQCFPYYALSLLAGLNVERRGDVSSYNAIDAIGLFKRTPFSVSGSVQAFLILLMDNVISHKSRLDARHNFPAEEGAHIVKDAFLKAGEKDICMGDTVETMIITTDGIWTKVFQLKLD